MANRIWVLYLVSYLVVVTPRFAFLVVNKRDADHKRPKQERRELPRLRAHNGLPPALARGVAHPEGLRQQLGERDEDEGPGAHQQNDRDLLAGHLVPQQEDDDRSGDGGQGGQEVVGEGLLWTHHRARPEQWGA